MLLAPAGTTIFVQPDGTEDGIYLHLTAGGRPPTITSDLLDANALVGHDVLQIADVLAGALNRALALEGGEDDGARSAAVTAFDSPDSPDSPGHGSDADLPL